MRTNHQVPATGLRGIADTFWQPDSACYGMDPEDSEEVFFPTRRDHEAIAEAKELCGMCPVVRECLNFALENGLAEGIWGGLTEDERAPWHKGLPERLDYSRVVAFFNGRDVHLTEAERDIVVDHAYARGWRPIRLGAALSIGTKHARDLLRKAEIKVADRDLTLDVPPNPYKKKAKRKRKRRAKTAVPATPNSSQPVTHSVMSTSSHAPLGKAA
ncbi:WhiB family transcriptional regulator [Streptomyces anulatus]|uniref:WhiB family transcriptional regulator n=1 Tax=Streptomyces anulatus TaxID=1892 RepID=UPI00386BF1EA|nr:WhiB family transcriptional regulator [Streptomyces anulatus]